MVDKPGKILIVRPSALGDVARTVPVLVSLKRACPQAQIDWLVNDAFADAIRHHPDLHEAIPFHRKRWGRFGRDRAVTAEVIGFWRELRRRRYDRVYDLQGLGRSGWFTWISGAPRRVGAADARELAWLGYNHRVRIPPAAVHTVDRMLAVVEAEGVKPIRDMRLYVGLEDRAWADKELKDHSSLALIAPTAAWLSKRWPVCRFQKLMARLPQLGFKACAVVGAESERPQMAELLGNECDKSLELKVLDFVGRTSVGQLMALIDRSGLVVANDSAALHLAIGLGRRCVGIFGPTDPVKVGPYRYLTGLVAAQTGPLLNYRAVGDDPSVISQITVDQVWDSVERVMVSPPPATLHLDGK